MDLSSSHFRLSDFSSCLRLEEDASDFSDSSGSPSKSVRGFNSSKGALHRSKFGMPELDFSVDPLKKPPSLPFIRQSKHSEPSIGMYSPADSPTESVQSLQFTNSISEMSELDSDVSTELETEDLEDDGEMVATPIQRPSAGGPRQIFHRPNRSVLGISFPLRGSTNNASYAAGPETATEAPMLFRSSYLDTHDADEEEESNDDESNDDDEGEDADTTISYSFQPYSGRSRLSSSRKSLWMPSAKVRRTQSMFATPEQMLHEQLGEIYRPPNCETSVSHCMSFLDRPECPVPTFTVRQDPFPRMSHDTLCGLIDGNFGTIYESIIVIDCRFEYEYEGGHIDGAINVNTKQQLEQVLFHQQLCDLTKSKLLVFHCEYSAFRSPMMASHLRKCDRELNAARYPYLYYPDVVVLEGGYSQFYASASHRCVPQNYVGMNTKEHQNTCKRELSRFRHGMKTRKTQMLGMSHSNTNSTPQLNDFKFPAPALALRSASVADFPKPKHGDSLFG